MRSSFTTTLATDEDADDLASITTSAFSACDAAYPLIWAGAGDDVHKSVAKKGLFTPVQTEYRKTYKAMDGDRIIGFATWNLPDPSAPAAGSRSRNTLPDIPGVNTRLWNEKSQRPEGDNRRYSDGTKDMHLSLLFVLPEYQGKGVASLLLNWGLKRADEFKLDTWVTSTPQAISVYEKCGWKVVHERSIDLGQYGGKGIYKRAWMMREPQSVRL